MLEDPFPEDSGSELWLDSEEDELDDSPVPEHAAPMDETIHVDADHAAAAASASHDEMHIDFADSDDNSPTLYPDEPNLALIPATPTSAEVDDTIPAQRPAQGTSANGDHQPFKHGRDTFFNSPGKDKTKRNEKRQRRSGDDDDRQEQCPGSFPRT